MRCRDLSDEQIETHEAENDHEIGNQTAHRLIPIPGQQIEE
jgi:hypothetical protein